MKKILAMIGVFVMVVAMPVSSSNGAVAEEQNVDAMSEFGATASNVFFYYKDVEAATAFYRDKLGLRVVVDYGFAKIMQVAPKSFVTLVDSAKGMHHADEPKTTAIALVTDQLDGWWDYVSSSGIELRSKEYNPVEGRPHHGFVAVDPEGYLLEFERFNPHPENEHLMPVLDSFETLYPEEGASEVPEGLGFKATIVWFYYKDMENIQNFYENILGFDLIVDQGWAKIYPMGGTGFFGPVDEQRGMHRFTEMKAVTLSILTDNIEGWFNYMKSHPQIKIRSDHLSEEGNTGNKVRTFVAYDPEGYYLEWDVFADVPDNKALLEAIRKP